MYCRGYSAPAIFAEEKNELFENAGELAISGFRAVIVKNGAKICDLRDFFENTRCCGKTCNKIAYMVKYGRTHKRDTTPVF